MTGIPYEYEIRIGKFPNPTTNRYGRFDLLWVGASVGYLLVTAKVDLKPHNPK